MPGSAGTTASSTASLTPTDTSEEITYWQSIQASKDARDLEAYLDRYGNHGAFTVLARNRAKLLRAHKVDGTSPAQQDTTRIKNQQQLAAEASLQVAFRPSIRPDSFFSYKIIDVLVSDLSLQVTQRADFKPALKSGGIRHLIGTLERKFGKAVKRLEIP